MDGDVTDIRPKTVPTYSLILYHALHAGLTFVFVIFAVAFLNSVPTFERGGLLYSAMSRFMTERDWGTSCALVAGVGLSTMFATNWIARSVAAGILCLAHIGMAVFLFMGNPYAPGSYIFCVLAVQAAFLSYSSAYVASRNAA